MKVAASIVVVCLAVACASAPTPVAAPASCPTIAPRDTTYPYVSYNTVVLDGKIVYARRGQRNLSAHASIPLDSAPADKALDNIRPREIRVLKGDSARIYEPCPGVGVIAVYSERRHWWWRW